MLIKSRNSISEKYTIQIKLLYVRNAKALSLYLILFYVTHLPSEGLYTPCFIAA